jgi:hypothetical protein
VAVTADWRIDWALPEAGVQGAPPSSKMSANGMVMPANIGGVRSTVIK